MKYLCIFLLLIFVGCAHGNKKYESHDNCDIQFKFSLDGVVSFYGKNNSSYIIVDCFWHNDGGHWALNIRKFSTRNENIQHEFISLLADVIIYADRFFTKHCFSQGVIYSITLADDDFQPNFCKSDLQFYNLVSELEKYLWSNSLYFNLSSYDKPLTGDITLRKIDTEDLVLKTERNMKPLLLQY